MQIFVDNKNALINLKNVPGESNLPSPARFTADPFA